MEAVLTCTHNQCFEPNKKKINIKIFRLNFFIYYNIKNLCILHGLVFVMVQLTITRTCTLLLLQSTTFHLFTLCLLFMILQTIVTVKLTSFIQNHTEIVYYRYLINNNCNTHVDHEIYFLNLDTIYYLANIRDYYQPDLFCISPLHDYV